MEAKATQALLNELVQTLKDGQEGYADAMTDVEDAQLKETFKKYAVQRAGYVTEIEDQMFQLNLHPDTNEGTSTTSKALASGGNWAVPDGKPVHVTTTALPQ